MDKVFNDIYADGLMELVLYYAGLENINEKIISMPSIRSVIVGFYWVMVGHKEIESIENLPEEERHRIGKLTKGTMKEKRDQARAIYLMERIKN